MTSVFLHAFPPLVAWANRWYPGDPHHWKTSARRTCEAHEASVRELILIPWLPYLLWAIFYYLKIFVISSKRIQERGYHTLFRYMTAKPKSLAGRLYQAIPRRLAPLIFMLWHVLFCAVTFCLSWVMWQHFWLNTAFLGLMFAMSAWNGGNYYFEVFAHRYVTDVGLPFKGVRGHEVQLPARAHSLDEHVQPGTAIALANLRAHSDPTLDIAAEEEDECWSDASPEFANGDEPFLMVPAAVTHAADITAADHAQVDRAKAE
jgi:hypothetical protein